MGPPNHPLSQSWGHLRFLCKAFLVFVAVLTIALLFKDVSKPVDEARAAVYARWWAAPLLFIVFLPFYLMYELIRYKLWQEIEAQQPDPRKRVQRPGGPPKRVRRRLNP